MSADRVEFFIERAREWWDIADALRAWVPPHDPLLWVWREAAWCHLLLTASRYDAVVFRLLTVFWDLTGTMPDVSPRPTNQAETLAAAADLFLQLRDVVSARLAHVFGRPTAAWEVEDGRVTSTEEVAVGAELVERGAQDEMVG